MMVEGIQEQTQYVLSQYMTSSQQVNDPLRFGHLLLMLSMIKELNSSSIKQIYFTSFSGELPLEKFLSDIYRSETLPLF